MDGRGVGRNRNQGSTPTGETLVVPFCSGILDIVKGVCITFIGAYILAISQYRTRSFIEAVFFAIFGLGLLVLNFGFIIQVFIWVRNVYNRSFVRGRSEAARDGHEGTEMRGIEIGDGARIELAIDIPDVERVGVHDSGGGGDGDGAQRGGDGDGARRELAIDLPDLERVGGHVSGGGSEIQGPRYFCGEHDGNYRTFAELLLHTKSLHGPFSFCLDCEVIFPHGDDGTSHFLMDHFIGTYPDRRGYFGEDNPEAEEMQFYIQGKISI